MVIRVQLFKSVGSPESCVRTAVKSFDSVGVSFNGGMSLIRVLLTPTYNLLCLQTTTEVYKYFSDAYRWCVDVYAGLPFLFENIRG